MKYPLQQVGFDVPAGDAADLAVGLRQFQRAQFAVARGERFAGPVEGGGGLFFGLPEGGNAKGHVVAALAVLGHEHRDLFRLHPEGFQHGAGLLLVGGTDHTISTTTAGGRGFTAVMVSWLAKFNPIFMVLTSFLLAFLSRGSSQIAQNFGLNHSFGDILTGIILFFIIGSEFFINYRISFRSGGEKEEGGHA